MIKETVKNIKMSIEELHATVEAAIKGINPTSACSVTCTGDNTTIDIIIPSEKPTLLQVWVKPNGLTIMSNCGKNPVLGGAIVDKVLQDVTVVKSVSLSFDGISEANYNTLKERLQDVSAETEPNAGQKYLAITRGKETLVVNYYPTSKKITIQGFSHNLFDEVFFEITTICGLGTEDTVYKYLTETKNTEKELIKYDDNIIETLIINLVGKTVYVDADILKNEEKGFLKTSAYLIYCNIDLPDYFPHIATAVKVVEGILNRIFMKMNQNHNSRDFNIYFVYTGRPACHHLKGQYCGTISAMQKQYIETLYSFLKTHRHTSFHNDGITPKTICKSDSRDIFEVIIMLIKTAHTNKIGLLQ